VTPSFIFICERKPHFTGSQRIVCLKVLQQLPEGLAIAVLAASPAPFEHHLSILPACLHPLAVEAAFPSIRRHHSLSLDFGSLKNTTAYAVLHAATAATIGFSALKELKLKQIPVGCDNHLHQMISAACRSAQDVQLHFRCTNSASFSISAFFTA
jgi:hypothetical protein